MLGVARQLLYIWPVGVFTQVFQMKNSIKFVVAAVALGFFASANASVIIQSTTQVTKKKVLVQYQQSPTGVLQSMKIKQKRIAKWCRKNGGCTYPVVVSNNTILATGLVGGESTVAAPVAVPEPATLALMGAGLLGMGLSAWRRRAPAA